MLQDSNSLFFRLKTELRNMTLKGSRRRVTNACDILTRCSKLSRIRNILL